LVNGMNIRPSLIIACWTVWALLTSPAVQAGAASFCGLETCAVTKAVAAKPLWWVPAQFSPGPPDGAAVEGWRLVRTPGPDKAEIVSIMRTADIMQSDAEFAGIMIRCRPKSGLQIAFAVIAPFHPRSRPKITVAINRTSMQFEAEVIPPGSLVALPNEAEVLAKGAWQSAKELSVDIEGDSAKIHGVVSLENLSGAVAQLQASCPQ
jgi:hypothetical protein